jgi:hypothetical protein
MSGETYAIEDIVICEFRGYDNSALFSKPRTWNENLISETNRIVILELDNDTKSVLKDRINETSSVSLCYGQGEYYMGDPNGKTLIHGKPHICYNEFYHSAPNVSHHESTPLTHAQAEALFGIKVIEWNFSEPINNTFR